MSRDSSDGNNYAISGLPSGRPGVGTGTSTNQSSNPFRSQSTGKSDSLLSPPKSTLPPPTTKTTPPVASKPTSNKSNILGFDPAKSLSSATTGGSFNFGGMNFTMPKVEVPQIDPGSMLPQQGVNFPGLGGLGKFLTQPSTLQGLANPGRTIDRGITEAYNSAIASATKDTPPLSRYTHMLGGFKPVADSILGGIQKYVSGPNGMANMAQAAGMLAPGLIKGTAMTGPLGLLGLHGMLAGGQPLADIMSLARPLMNAKSQTQPKQPNVTT